MISCLFCSLVVPEFEERSNDCWPLPVGARKKPSIEFPELVRKPVGSYEFVGFEEVRWEIAED